jgi:alpha-1,2-glucosyltransferase
MKLTLHLPLSQSNKRVTWNWIAIQAVALLALLAVLLVEFAYLRNARLLSDESFNFRQITRFLNGDFSLEPAMNAIPGYHALVALAMFLFHKTGVFSARLFSAGISFITILVFYALAVKTASPSPLTKTFQFAFFPLLFPFFPLIYMDILGVLLVLVALFLVLARHYTLAGLVGILSILARTNNIAWFAFLYVLVYTQNYGLDWRAFFRSWRETWVFWLGFGLFLAFLILNHGIALSDASVQPLFRFETGNLFFLLFLCFFLFLPRNLAGLPQIAKLLRAHRWVLIALVLTFGLYWLTFRVDHPFNLVELDYYWRNRLLLSASQHAGEKALFFLPVALASLSLAVIRLREKRFYWLYPFAVFSLVPFWLIEPRYSFVPLSLFLLFKEEGAPWVERLTLVLYVFCSAILVYLTRNEIMFI